MYNTTPNYKEYIKKPSRVFESKVVIGNRTFTNSDIIKLVSETVQSKNGFSIGNTVSQSMEMTLRNDGGAYASIGVANVSVGLQTANNTYEDVPLGVFNIDEVSKNDYTVKLTCYDNMIKFETGYFSKLGDTPTLQQVVDELKSLTGVDYDTTNWTIPNYTVTKLTGYTCREVLGYVASICGGNAYITRQGKFTVVTSNSVDYTITADNFNNGGYTLEDSTYKIGMITCQNKNLDSSSSSDSSDYDSSDDTNTISTGSLASDTMELTFKNPWVTTSILTDIYNKLNGFSYIGYDLKWQGDLSLDVGDIVSVKDQKNIIRKAFIFANKMTYTGGLASETSAKGETKNSNSFSANGSNADTINRISVKLLIAEKALITKANISDLQATNARIDTLNASVATIDTALINYATIDELAATNANVAKLNASVANIDSALVNKANVADLTATNATVSNLSADVANIQTLIGGNLTIANMQSLVLSSDKVTVNDGFIKNAMIESLDVTKINAGTLNTNKISVSSSDGGLVIAGATQQFKDKNKNVRLQMGQDTTGEFSFILVGKDGKSTLIDANGIHEGAIADKLIKTNMVADQAITSQQINYSSFATGFNAATNSNYINASKVAIDLTGQTLDIAFNNINTKVDGVKTTTDTNTTSINAIQGQISTLISNTTITKDGNTTQLKDAYNGTVNTINSMATTIGQHTTSINANTGNITSLNSSVSSIQDSLTSISASLSSTQSTVSTQTTQISSVTATANTALSNINNLQVGGRNLLYNSGNFATLTNWTTSTTDFYATVSNGELIVTRTGTATGVHLCENMTVDLINGQVYTLSLYGKSNITSNSFQCGLKKVSDNSCSQFSNATGDFTFDTANTYKKLHLTFTHTLNAGRYMLWWSSTSRPEFVINIQYLKLEIGNQSTDWTPAPEDVDSSIAGVNTTATNALNTANTASTNIANLTTTVNTTITRVSSLELTTSGLTTRVGNTETAISSLDVGGRNFLKDSSGNLGTSWGGGIDTGYLGNKALVNSRSGFSGSTRQLYGRGVTLPTTTAGAYYTLSFYLYIDTDIALDSNDGSIFIRCYQNGSTTVYQDLCSVGYTTSTAKGTWIYMSITDKLNFDVDANNCFFNVALGMNGHVKVSMIKFEKGTKATSWTPSPEDADSSIQAVKDYATTTINSNVSTINQTTNAIQANVSSLQSSVSTINTTLGNKADSSTVTSLSNTVSSLQTSVTGINASITTLNSNVSSVTTTANNAYNAINSLQVGGRNRALGTATAKIGTGFTGVANYCPSMYTVLTSGLVATSPVTVSFDFAYTNLTKNSNGGLWLQGNGDVTGWTTGWNGYNITSLIDWTNGSGSLKVKYTFTISTTQMTNGKFTLAIRTDYLTGGSFTVSNFKVEQGNTKTDWSPAPEDTDSQITTINSSMSTMQSSITALQSQIALKVEQSNIDSAITTVNNKITATNATISSMQSSINMQLNSITSQVSQASSNKNLCVNSAFKYDPTTNISVVGSNPYYGVRDKATYTSWGISAAPVASDYVWHQRFDNVGDNYIYLPYVYAKVKPNTTYTVSFYYLMFDSGTKTFSSTSSYVYGRKLSEFGNPTYSNTLGTMPLTYSNSYSNWQRSVATVTTTSDTDCIIIRFGWNQSAATRTEMLITGVQIEEGSSVTDFVEGTYSVAGTTISQNSSAVMTSFNNISNYFQVSADGAKFGNIASGDYTLMNSAGLQHHINGTNYNYMYVTRAISFSYNGSSSQYADVNVNFDSDTIALLNGKVPTVVVVNLKFSPANVLGVSASGDVYISNVTATGVTLKAKVYTYYISVDTSTYVVDTDISGIPSYYNTVSATSASTVSYNITYAGSVNGSILILA